MNVTIHPKKLAGKLVMCPSKSLSHRAIIAASLAKGKSIISNVIISKDIEATIKAMEVLGAKIEIKSDTLIIEGSEVKRLDKIIDAYESGSTLRFLIPIALVNKEPITFVGHNNLVKRPLDSYLAIFDKLGIKYNMPNDSYLPLYLNGGLVSTTYELAGNVSSQFITGLLFALPLLNGDSKIIITTDLESKGYVDLTLDVLKLFGIKIKNNNYHEFIIPGNQTYQPLNYQVEGDYSQSAFFLVAGALGADITILGMNLNSSQGDKKILEDIKSFGGNLIIEKDYLKCLASNTKGTTIDFSQSPDLGPALTVLASLSTGKSNFINAERLRIKECDRITCMKEELTKMGAKIEEFKSGMKIEGVPKLQGAIVDSHNDHRVAMSLAMASLKTEGSIKIMNAECVSKSFPNFWEVFESLGGEIEYE